MKKMLLSILCILLIFTFASCGGQSEGEGDSEISEDLFTFETETFDGEAFSMEDVKDAKLVMINFWEPWCGPCVGEMGDLEKIYEEFKDDGFVLLGVFSETAQDDDARAILEENGTTYPILRYCDQFDGFQTGYVPTTVFLTGEGKLMMEDPIIGAQSYDTWHSAVKGMMEGLKDD